jgi:hypothetical protein
VTMRNAPHPYQRARYRCNLEWIRREVFGRCLRWEDSVRHFIAETKI